MSVRGPPKWRPLHSFILWATHLPQPWRGERRGRNVAKYGLETIAETPEKKDDHKKSYAKFNKSFKPIARRFPQLCQDCRAPPLLGFEDVAHHQKELNEEVALHYGRSSVHGPQILHALHELYLHEARF